MALISADNYNNLAAVSVSANQIKVPKKFFNISISGKRRGKMNAGFYQCAVKIDDSGDGSSEDFFILNQDTVYFIPLYMKKYWARYELRQMSNGEKRDYTVDFGWEENLAKPEGAKTEYIIAGYLWDANKKNIVKHPKDLEDNNIKAGEPVLVYFRCKGTKCNCAYELIKRVNDAAKNLTPLSDNPTFEQNVINPRRFLIKASITQRDSKYGAFDVFDFNPTTQLPDDFVLKVLEAANNKFLEDFNKQFDITETVKNSKTSQSGSSTEDTSTKQNYDRPPVEEDVTIPDTANEPNPGDDFNIDILN